MDDNFNLKQWSDEQDARRAPLIRAAIEDGTLDDAAAFTERVLLSKGFSRYEALAFGMGAHFVKEARQDPTYLRGFAMVDELLLRKILEVEGADEQVEAWLWLIRELVAQCKMAGMPALDNG